MPPACSPSHLLRLLSRRADDALLLPLNVLHRSAVFLQLCQLCLGRLLPLLALCQLAALHGRRLAVKHKHGLDAGLHHADGAIEHACQVRRDLPGLVGQLALSATLAHRDEELVDLHGRVDRNLTARKVVHFVILDAARCVIVQQLRETLDAHDTA
eukprot:scaffold8263_cov104-Isochrysis_galbana.AAC.6